MSNVTLRIGGREYTVACADGEEAHVTGLGQLIDSKLADMPNALAHSETRSLLFGALLLADEVFEQRSRAANPAPDPALPGQLEAQLDAIAARIERLATMIEAAAVPLAQAPTSA